MAVVLVAVFGAAGVLARYGLSFAVQSIWTIAAINLAGSFLLGFMIHAGAHWSVEARDAIGVGFLGGFTTFSTLTVQTVLEADGSRHGVAFAYLALTVLGGLAAALVGYYVGRLR